MNFFASLNNFCLDFKDFSTNYKFIRKSKDPQLGEVQLMKHKPSGKVFQVKEQSVENENDLNELLSALEDFLPYNSCNNFMVFLGFSIRQILLPAKIVRNPTTNSVKWTVYMIYEYIDHDLEKEIALKIKSDGRNFEESFLWKIMSSIVNCLEILEKTGRRYGDFRPCNVYYSKQENKLKLLYSNYAKTSFELIMAKKIAYYNCFLAPEQLEIILNGRSSEKGLDLIKCEIFSIGILILFIACFQNKERLYNINEPVLLFQALNNKILWLRKQYSEVFCSLIERMLEIDSNLRPNTSEIKNYIKKNFVKTGIAKLPSESTIPKHYTTFNSFDSNMIISAPNEKIGILDSISLQKMLNESKITKVHNKSFSNASREIVLLESKDLNSSLQKSLELNSEKKIPFFEKVKKSELNNDAGNNIHRRNTSEITVKNKNLKVRSSLEGLGSFSLETSTQEVDKIATLIKNLEKKILYEKNNPSVLKSGITKVLYPDGSTYMGSVQNGHREGKGIYYFSNKEVYGGEWKEDRFEGKGIYIYDNGDVYDGFLKKGLKEGHGNYYYSNGDHYDGEWINNEKNGYGIFYFNNSFEKFEGFWKNNEKNGSGVYYFSSGDKFEGNWIHGKKEGKGVVHFSNKTKFEGVWNNNMPNGHGVISYINGDLYDGNFAFGNKEGLGTYKHSTGSAYEGKWDSDEQSGAGTFLYSNGDRYEGSIQHGMRNGSGVYHYHSGEQYEGSWSENLRHGKGRLIISEGNFYEGDWFNGKRHGFGVMVSSSGEKYEGQWILDKKEGKGVYTWCDGTVYNGNWKGDKMNGEGKYVDRMGVEISGLWLDNEFWEEC